MKIRLLLSLLCALAVDFVSDAQVLPTPDAQVVERIKSGIVAFNDNDYDGALEILGEFDMPVKRLKSLGFMNSDCRTINHIIGKCRMAHKEYDKALPYLLRADSLYDKSINIQDKSILGICNDLADTYMALGQYEKALTWGKKQLMKSIRLSGNFSRDAASSHLILFRIYFRMNNQALCMSELKKYLDIIVEGGYFIYDVDSNIGLALFYCRLAYNLNQADEAVKLLRAIERVLEDHDPYSLLRLKCCNNLSEMLMSLNPEESRKYLERALTIAGKLPESALESIDVLATFNNLMLTEGLGDSEESLRRYRELVDSFNVPEDSPIYGAILNNMGLMLMPDYQEAATYFDKSLRILLSNDLLDVSSVLDVGMNLIIALWNSEDFKRLPSVITAINTYLSRQLRETFAGLPERKRTDFWNKIRPWYQIVLPEIAVRVNEPELWAAFYDALLQSRSILLSSTLSIRTIINESDDISLKKMYEQCAELGEMEGADNILEALEIRMLEEMKKHGRFMDTFDVTHEDVRKALRKGEASIEIFRFDPYEIDRYFISDVWKETSPEPKPYDVTYYALVQLPSLRYPAVVRLCMEDDLYDCDLERLYECIWKPLEDILANVSEVYFSPEGAIFSLPVESATDSEGKFVWEKFKTRRVSSTREVLKRERPTSGEEAVLFGGIRYDLSTEGMMRDGEKYRDLTRGFSQERSDRRSIGAIEPLPGTKIEVESIWEYINSRKKPRLKVNLFTDSAATEAAFKSFSGKNVRILHLATHGFYEEPVLLPQYYVNDGKEARKYERDALKNCGLLFAGADNVIQSEPIPPEVEDGILDAYEIAALDFHNTDLVVMSACGSGLGPISGDGVFGLQRGFKKAGVKSILMSLWNVDDEATTFFMKEFYRLMLENADKSDAKQIALAGARDAVRKHPRWEDYVYWAPFILLD